jgi:hypothetical protein
MSVRLLEVANFDATVKQTRRGASPPLMMEFQVNPELAPFLVSSTRSVQWVAGASGTGMLRAAVRKRQGIESDVVGAILQMGREAEWGNVHPLDSEGVRRCVEHVAYYDLAPVEILVASDTDLDGVSLPEGVNVLHAEWLPRDVLVVVPVDRGFVGTMGTIGKHKAVAVVHNASRGVGVAWR